MEKNGEKFKTTFKLGQVLKQGLMRKNFLLNLKSGVLIMSSF